MQLKKSGVTMGRREGSYIVELGVHSASFLKISPLTVPFSTTSRFDGKHRWMLTSKKSAVLI
jgi:hypothetical protein